MIYYDTIKCNFGPCILWWLGCKCVKYYQVCKKITPNSYNKICSIISQKHLTVVVMNQLSSWLPVPELLILISLLYVIHYHMVILVSQQCQSLAAKCSHCSRLLNLQVTISHINSEWMRPILLKYKLQLEYCPGSCPWHCIWETSLSWILALTLSNFLVLDLNLDNVLRNCFVSIAICLITQWTSPLNSHWKTVLDDIQHLYICQYYHIWSLWSHDGHPRQTAVDIICTHMY